MKTITKQLTVLVVLIFSINSFAQSSEFMISPYLGVGGSMGGDKINTPAIGVNAEYFLDETFSLGIHASYSTLTSEGVLNLPDEDVSGITIGGLINYYWTDSDSFNFYTGGSIGYDGHSGPFVDSGIYYEVHAGGRYQLSENLGIYSELGFGLSLLKLGVSFGL